MTFLFIYLMLKCICGMKKDEIDANDAANKMFAELEPGHYDDHENQTIDQLLH